MFVQLHELGDLRRSAEAVDQLSIGHGGHQLNIAFSLCQNGAFNNNLFSASTICGMKQRINARHASLERLLEIGKEAGVVGPAAVAAELVQSEQTVTNWGRRGVSKMGAMKAQARFGCSGNWILHGDLPKYINSASVKLPSLQLTASGGPSQYGIRDVVQRFRDLLKPHRPSRREYVVGLLAKIAADVEDSNLAHATTDEIEEVLAGPKKATRPRRNKGQQVTARSATIYSFAEYVTRRPRDFT